MVSLYTVSTARLKCTHPHRVPSDQLAARPELPRLNKREAAKRALVLLGIPLAPVGKAHSDAHLRIAEVLCFHVFQQGMHTALHFVLSSLVIVRELLVQLVIRRQSILVRRRSDNPSPPCPSVHPSKAPSLAQVRVGCALVGGLVLRLGLVASYTEDEGEVVRVVAGGAQCDALGAFPGKLLRVLLDNVEQWDLLLEEAAQCLHPSLELLHPFALPLHFHDLLADIALLLLQQNELLSRVLQVTLVLFLRDLEGCHSLRYPPCRR